MNKKQIKYSFIKNNNKFQFCIFLFVLLTMTLIMIYSYMPLDKMSPGHDGFFHYRRMSVLMEALKNSQFPVYLDYAAFNEYGYATKWFYPDFILIPFAYLGNYIGIFNSFKILYFTMTILCGIFTYWSAKNIYKNKLGAAITAILFTFCTYRLQDMFQRFAIGEALSFTFIPIVFWGLYEIIKGDYKKWYIISIGFSLLIFTHVLSAILTSITVVIIICMCYKDFILNKLRIKYLIIAGIITLLLSAYFVFPFIELYESNKYIFHEPDISTLAQNNKISFIVMLRGLLTFAFIHLHRFNLIPCIGLILFSTIFLRLCIRKKHQFLKIVDIGILIGIIYIICALEIIPWSIFPLKLFNFIQFPWRLYEFSSFFFALAGGYYISILLQKKKNTVISLFTIVLVGATSLAIVINSISYKREFKYDNFEIVEPSFASRFHLMNLEYLPYSLPVDSLGYIKNKGDNIYAENINTEINNIKRIKGGITFEAKINQSDILELPLIYYKGYYASCNNKNIPTRESKNGMVEIAIKESGNVKVEFSGTPLQKYSIYITLVSIFLLCFYIFWHNRKKRNNYVNTII